MWGGDSGTSSDWDTRGSDRQAGRMSPAVTKNNIRDHCPKECNAINS